MEKTIWVRKPSLERRPVFVRLRPPGIGIGANAVFAISTTILLI